MGQGRVFGVGVCPLEPFSGAGCLQWPVGFRVFGGGEALLQRDPVPLNAVAI